MWITGGGNIIIIIFSLMFFFSSRWKALELYLLLWFCMWGRNVVSLIKLDKLLWTTFQTSVVIDSSALPSLRGGHVCANDLAHRTHHSAGTMRHGPFHCITPWLTSLVHMACRLSVRSKAHPRLSFPCTAADDTQQIDFTDWITISVLCVCMFMCWLYVLKDVHGQLWQG